jgi:hypothetical protein
LSAALTALASPAVKLVNRHSHNECLIDLIIVMWIRSGRAGGQAQTPVTRPRPYWFVGSILFSMLFALAIPHGKRRAAVFVRSFPKPKTCQRNSLPCHIFTPRPATPAPQSAIPTRAKRCGRAAAPSDFLNHAGFPRSRRVAGFCGPTNAATDTHEWRRSAVSAKPLLWRQKTTCLGVGIVLQAPVPKRDKGNSCRWGSS